jgi:hypothetical protein
VAYDGLSRCHCILISRRMCARDSSPKDTKNSHPAFVCLRREKRIKYTDETLVHARDSNTQSVRRY